MKKIPYICSIIVCIGGLLLSSCATGNFAHMKSELDKAILNGKVFNEEGLPLEGATIILDNVFSTQSDINGRFLFNYLPLGEHTVKVNKDGYTTAEISFNFKLKERINKRKKPLVLRVKLFSYNYLLSEGMFFLQDENYEKLDLTLQKLALIDDKDESYLYLMAAYYTKIKKYDEAIVLLEQLLDKDRNNEYYYLTLIKIYNTLEMYEKEALICLSLGRRKSDFIEYLKKAAYIYKTKLNDPGTYKKIIDEYTRLKELEAVYDTP